ncbi:MAG TPA: hypothetical protein VMU66_08230, partial [Gaiellales bacterium]|nr:hypothetical protein [Gaiellales bacterium]
MAGEPAVRAVVSDMEGVLHVDWRPLPGSARAIARLGAAGVPVAVLSNTTGRSRDEIAVRLEAMGMRVAAGAIVTAVSATADLVRRRYPSGRVHLLAEPGAAAEFDGVLLVDDPAEADLVVVGGPHAGWCYPQLNEVFRAVLAGTPMVAMQRNR